MEETIMSVEDTVRKIVTRIVRRPATEFARETTFKDMGADSLDIVQILSAIEDKYDIEMEDDALADIKDMAGFVDYIERKISENGD
jgi:acyl carrier protein